MHRISEAKHSMLRKAHAAVHRYPLDPGLKFLIPRFREGLESSRLTHQAFEAREAILCQIAPDEVKVHLVHLQKDEPLPLS
jgi:hypothetical protein